MSPVCPWSCLEQVTRSSDSTESGFEAHKLALIARAEKFLGRAELSRESIGRVMVDRILRDDLKILVHGLSRVVLEVLRQAWERGKRLNVFVAECRTPNRSWGKEMAEVRRCCVFSWFRVANLFAAHHEPDWLSRVSGG